MHQERPVSEDESTQTRTAPRNESRDESGAEQKIGAAKTVIGLCDAIAGIREPIKGASGEYSASELIMKIKEVLATGELTDITRALGIREKLTDLFLGAGAKVRIISDESGGIYTGTLPENVAVGSKLGLSLDNGKVFVPRGGTVEHIGPRPGHEGLWFTTDSGAYRIEPIS